ncbi:MAG: DUF362 domain-containing protein [Phycisphaerae bacterium]|nr:DUF362 domain-containing protein [Phycisphaerae bacterium]
MKSRVALIRCESYQPADLEGGLDALLDSLGGLSSFVQPGQRVLIKPNCIAAIPSERAGQTSGELIVALARRVRQAGATPVVGDSPAWGRIEGNLAAIGALEPLRAMGVPIAPFRRTRRLANHPMRIYRRFTVARDVLEADRIINLPKLKAHKQLGLTAAIKNMFGCVAGKRKAWWHFRAGDSRNYFGWMLVELFDLLRPCLTIVDGVVGQEGDGPIKGTPRRFGWLVGGVDGIAIERVCAELTGFAPEELRTLAAARTLGIGQPELEQIEVVGRSLEQERVTDFRRPPEMLEIRFPLLRVLKSTLKNLLLRHGG